MNPALISGLSQPFGIAVSGDKLFVTHNGFGFFTGTVAEYTTSGATVNAELITGLDFPFGIAVSGGNLFVTNATGNGTIGKYTTSGATVNPALVSELGGPSGIELSGGNLFVANQLSGTIGEYTTSGAPVNPTLISGLNTPTHIAVVSESVPDESSTLTMMLFALTATFGLTLGPHPNRRRAFGALTKQRRFALDN